MSAQELADLLEAVQVILDDYLLEGGEQNLWAMDYVAAEYERGRSVHTQTFPSNHQYTQRKPASINY